MPEADCNVCKEYDFGEGLQHVQSIIVDGLLIVNSTYIPEKTIDFIA